MALDAHPRRTGGWDYAWRIRLRVWRQNLLELAGELRQRPVTLVGGVIVLLYLVAAAAAGPITIHDPTRGSLLARFDPPAWEEGGSWRYPLGTDDQGRDLLTRIVYGARLSLAVGVLSVAASVVVGVVLGALSGYYRGWLDEILSRFADLLLAFPFLVFAIGMMAFLGPGFINLILALSFKGWVEFFRLVRGEMLGEKVKEYVEAARVSGRSDPAIMASEILPNILPPDPAWGPMVASGRDYLLTAWWVSTFPGLAILILVVSINVFGEGLRDILDPRLKVE
jgi:peptide/nickel transport system permease protein